MCTARCRFVYDVSNLQDEILSNKTVQLLRKLCLWHPAKENYSVRYLNITTFYITKLKIYTHNKWVDKRYF